MAVGFNVPWDPDSKASLASVAGGGSAARYVPNRGFEPMIQNAANDTGDGAGMAAATAARRWRPCPRSSTACAHGMTLVPVSTLAGMPHQAINRDVTGFNLLQVRADNGVFLAVAGLLVVIKWLFFVAIAVGVARAVLMAALAVKSRFDGKAPVPPLIDPERFVSELIPAFNEQKVIVGSISRVLASTEVRIELIVIDDGSTDGTSAAVLAAYADEPRVRLLTLENGGKARALNKSMALAQGDVIIALDADTQFETMTIARLARWFADPA